MKAPSEIVISRTDSIGDVVLTLPVTGILKKHYPDTRIVFLGKAYTKPVIEACEHVDRFVDINDIDAYLSQSQPDAIVHVLPNASIAFKALKAAIPIRIGTTNRVFHWPSCNKLVKLSRRKSDLHEAQLNIKLLEPFGINTDYTLNELPAYYGLNKVEPLQPELKQLIRPEKLNVVLHPKSQGSAREWGLENFKRLVDMLNEDKFNVFISGTEKEGQLLKPLLNGLEHRVTDITGKMPLDQFISFIQQCDALIANSTGPLHIAAALGKQAIGIYPPMKPIYPGRWAPVGINASYFVLDKACEDCRKTPESCSCIKSILPASVAHSLHNGYKSKFAG